MIALALSGCQQSQDGAPASPPAGDAGGQQAPLVKGDLDALPELETAISAKSDESDVAPGVEAIPEKTGDRKALLDKVASENESLAKRVRQLEAELREKEQVSRRISAKIEQVKRKLAAPHGQ